MEDENIKQRSLMTAPGTGCKKIFPFLIARNKTLKKYFIIAGGPLRKAHKKTEKGFVVY
jgi:hypothetical protein